jgi:hypothetical protein
MSCAYATFVTRLQKDESTTTVVDGHGLPPVASG